MGYRTGTSTDGVPGLGVISGTRAGFSESDSKLQKAVRAFEMPVWDVAGVAGAPSQLPCLVSHPLQGDAPVLVLWYKDGARFPFYTLDLREGGEKQEEYVEHSVEGRVKADVRGAHLTFDPVQGHDSGRYRCRVDFEVSPTVFALVSLTVYVVPSRLVIMDQVNRTVPAGFLGPLTEGEALTLYCVATGGQPTPEVTWWRGATLLANHSVVLGQEEPFHAPSTHAPNSAMVASFSSPSSSSSSSFSPSSGVGVGVRQVRTELSIPALTRDYLHANLTCRASNNNITEPLSTTLPLLLHLPTCGPTSVRIRAPEASLVEGQQTRLECVAEGAYPAATLAWTKTTLHGVPSTLPSTSRHLGERTSSFVTLVPESEDDHATLTCTAHNPNISGPGVTTTTVIQVVFAPRVSLQLGANLGSQPITEGKDVYFECEVVANPPAREIVWRKDDVLVTNQRKAGVLVSGRNLVLQMVRRSSAGNYTCSAANTLAAATSNVVHLDIRYLPKCIGGPLTVAVAEGEPTRLSCRVDAHPDDGLSFTWFFNSSLDTAEVAHHQVKVLPGLSILDYTPRSPRDYGTLSCWATNAVGTQADPCRFTVVEAGPPERVDNCVLVNLTVESLEVGCSPGKDGGLPQRFVARVYAAPTHTLLATMEEDQAPRFHVGGLTPGQDYLITVTAVNAKGASQPQQIDAVRLKVAEKRMVDVTSPPVSPLVGVFLGLVGGFVLLLVVGVVLSRARSNRCRCWGYREGEGGVVTSGNTADLPNTTPSSAHNHVPHAHIYTHASAITLGVKDRRDAPDVLRTINAELLETQICPEIILARVPPPPYTRTQAVLRETLQLPPTLISTTTSTSSSLSSTSSPTTVSTTGLDNDGGGRRRVGGGGDNVGGVGGGGVGERGGYSSHALYWDSNSPLHLLHDESFV
ncbi:protein turtle homolog B-like [Panulirus ornatus]|uniref:protein turtle homolog B-like n=1 Tax=Panulirus ornatus TaxID=150431 RepID=UPI003A8A38B8